MPRAPITRTYSKKSSILHRRNSVEALNALLAENIQKRQIYTKKQTKKVKPIQLKELPPVDEYHHLLADSFKVVCPFDDTFDKLLKSPQFESILNEKQISKTNPTFHTPNKSDNKNETNEKQEDTLDKSVINSLCVERVSLNVKKDKEYTTLSSYTDDSNLPKFQVNVNNQSIEQSFIPIFSKKFQEANKKLVIASTPAALIKTPLEYPSILNDLSPISSKSQCKSLIEKSYDEIHTWSFKPPKEFEPSDATPKIRQRGRPRINSRLKNRRKNNVISEKKLKAIGTFAKDCLLKDDKLNMEPKVVMNKSIDILGISYSIKLGCLNKNPLEHEKSSNLTDKTNSSSSNSDNVVHDSYKSPRTPVRYLNLRKRTVPITSRKASKLKKSGRSHTNGSNSTKDFMGQSTNISSNNEISEPERSDIKDNVVNNEEHVERLKDLTSDVNIEESHEQFSYSKNAFPNKDDKNDSDKVSTQSLSDQLIKTPENQEDLRSDINSFKKILPSRRSTNIEDNFNFNSDMKENIKGTHNDGNSRWTINVTSELAHLKDSELLNDSNIVEFPKKPHVRRLYSLKFPNDFKNFITKHDLLRNCSTPKTARNVATSLESALHGSISKDLKGKDLNVTQLNNTSENQMPISQLLLNESLDLIENSGSSTNSKTSGNFLEYFSKMNVSELNSSFQHQMSVSGNEKLMLNDDQSNLSFSEGNVLHKPFNSVDNCLEECEKLCTTELNLSRDQLLLDERNRLLSQTDYKDNERCNEIDGNGSPIEAVRKKDEFSKSFLNEYFEEKVSQLNMIYKEMSIDDESDGEGFNDNLRNSSVENVSPVPNEELEKLSDQENQNNSGNQFRHLIEHSYFSSRLGTSSNSSELDESDENSESDEDNVDDENEIILVSDQDTINEPTNKPYNNSLINKVDEIIEILSSDEEEHEDVDENRYEKIHENSDENIHENHYENSDENIHENHYEKIHENSDENIHENCYEKINKNSDESINENSHDSIRENMDHSEELFSDLSNRSGTISNQSLCNKSSNLSEDKKCTDINNTNVSETVNNETREEEDLVVTDLIKRPLILRQGKSWRRSLLQIRRKSALYTTPLSTIRQSGSCWSRANGIDRRTDRLSHKEKLSRSILVKSALSTIRQSINSSLLELSLAVAENTYGTITNDTVYPERTIGESFLDLTRNNSIYEETPYERAKSIVLRKCEQEKPILFKECYSETTLEKCRKIGEGVYGEVFLYKNSEGSGTVMKVIPIEGNQLVNDEPQKKFSEILSEIVIAMELSNLRHNVKNNTSGFSEVKTVRCVQGKYPDKLLDLWELYDEIHKSENDSPEMFGDDQLYIVLELSNGGMDMESFVFKNADEAYSLFKQVACTLAVAEQALEFEHRDLHWGNVLISRTDKNKVLRYCLDGREFFVPSNGIEVSIIDFTLSRVKIDDAIIYNDISKDPDLFSATGEYQFEIYKLMQQKNNNEWEHFEAYTNVLWMHYVIHKMITALRYANTSSKTHKTAMHKLKQLEKDLLKYHSVYDLVNNEFIS